MPTLNADEIIGHIESFGNLKVAVVGETITDEYVYTHAMGKSGKEPVLVTKQERVERHVGGAEAIANHVSQFTDHVKFISRNTGIIKRRYIDSYSLAKLLGVYQMGKPTKQDEEHMVKEVIAAREWADLIIVADYGHGLITHAVVVELCYRPKFLAVNTQCNADNIGYHTLHKYPRADFACLHSGEFRMDARDRDGDLKTIMEDSALRLGAKSVMATMGKEGTLLYQTFGGFSECRSLATGVLERVGAGDAVLAVASLAACKKANPDTANILANLAGAQAVRWMGNAESISREGMIDEIRSLYGP